MHSLDRIEELGLVWFGFLFSYLVETYFGSVQCIFYLITENTDFIVIQYISSFNTCAFSYAAT